MRGTDASTLYTQDFFESRRRDSVSSARVIVPLLLERLSVNKVCDIGCADGTWLSVCQENGITEIHGIDGPWVSRDQLLIPEENFVSHDLSASAPEIDSRFDLAMSVEVAEHLPESRARDFITFLTSLSDTVLFSAAVVGQGGTGHINEQWQSYWAQLFWEHGYHCYDFLRSHIWTNHDVNIIHAQNLLLYAKNEGVFSTAENSRVHPELYSSLAIIHPELYTRRIQQERSKRLSYRIRRKLKSFTGR